MKWFSALLLGAILGFVLPMFFGGQGGVWMAGWTKWGTIRPVAGSPGLLFSVPLFVCSAIAFRMFFNWHKG
jgi:hypothetical protein